MHPLADYTYYFWRISATYNNTVGQPSSVYSFRTNISGTCTKFFLGGPDIVPLTITPTPVTPSPAPVHTTITPTRVPGFTFTPNINAYCRSGPDTSFPSLEFAMAGQPYPMDGRNLDNTWYRIMFSATKGCWVSASAGTPSAGTSSLRVLADVPTPTLTMLLSCSSITDETCCNAQPACVWIPSVARPSYCGDK